MVWGLRTQPSRNTGVSPYFMVYGAEAVLPVDVAFGSPRVEHYDQSSADLTRELEINCTEERRLTSCLRTAKCLEAIRRYHNRNIKDRSFVVGDLVLNTLAQLLAQQARRECTSCLHLGKDLSWSLKLHALHLIYWRTQMERACPTPST